MNADSRARVFRVEVSEGGTVTLPVRSDLFPPGSIAWVLVRSDGYEVRTMTPERAALVSAVDGTLTELGLLPASDRRASEEVLSALSDHLHREGVATVTLHWETGDTPATSYRLADDRKGERPPDHV